MCFPSESNTAIWIGSLKIGANSKFWFCSIEMVTDEFSLWFICLKSKIGCAEPKYHWLKNQFKSSPDTSSNAKRNCVNSAALNLLVVK